MALKVGPFQVNQTQTPSSHLKRKRDPSCETEKTEATPLSLIIKWRIEDRVSELMRVLQIELPPNGSTIEYRYNDKVFQVIPLREIGEHETTNYYRALIAGENLYNDTEKEKYLPTLREATYQVLSRISTRALEELNPSLHQWLWKNLQYNAYNKSFNYQFLLQYLNQNGFSIKIYKSNNTSNYLTHKTEKTIRLFEYDLNGRKHYDLLLKKKQ